jgi:predicted ferric reductase
VGFMMMTFFAVLTSDQLGETNMWKVLGIAVLLYFWFLVTARTHTTTLLIVIALILTSYVLTVSLKSEHNEKTKRRVTKVIKICNYSAVVATVIGFFFYFLEKRYEYKQTFSYKRFIFGDIRCRNKSPTLRRAILSRTKNLIPKM